MKTRAVYRKTLTKIKAKLLEIFPSEVNYTIDIHIGNKVYKTPKIDGVINSGPETHIFQCISMLPINEDSIFLDIGSNIGQTLLATRSAFPSINYVGIEPNSSCISYMRKLIEINKISKTKLIPVAVTEKNCILQLEFYSKSESDPSASLVPGFRDNQVVHRSIPVPCFKWAEIKKVIKIQAPISIVKIDVEGAEEDVIKSAQELTIKDRPFFIIEVLPAYNDEWKDRIKSQNRIEEFFQERNYFIYHMKKDNNGNLSHMNLINHFGLRSDWKDSDYLVAPKEHSAKLEKSCEKFGVKLRNSL